MTSYGLDDFELELSPTLPDYNFVNFSYELGQIMTKYDFLETRWMILK